jgi:protein-tyrosine phosphatase
LERVLALDGCFNFRDLGGYPTADGRKIAWRQLFRSDALHALTDADIDVLLGDAVGLSDVIDLRSTAELKSEGRGRLEATEAVFHHTPLFDGAPSEGRVAAADMSLGQRYFGLLEIAQAQVARIVGVIADAQGAAVYHCAAGKDRTGVISAVLLGLLGVEDSLVIADYALTQQNLDAILERLNAMQGYKDMLEALPPDTQHANPETMAELIERVADRWGGFEGYVREAGVEDETLVKLRDRVLEPA